MGLLTLSELPPLRTERWTEFRDHDVQQALWKSEARFVVVAAGRRSGKSEIAKRKLVTRALESLDADARFFAAAPTRDQAKALWWDDLKDLIPRSFLAGTHETSLTIRMVHGPRIVVVGLDKPQRIEGRPWDGGVVDEVADVKANAWPAHIRPALADRGGWCWFTGVPEGRNHFYDLFLRHREGMAGWESFHWVSADILAAEEIAMARAEMDSDLFAQEFEASFITFRGRAYRHFTQESHCWPLRSSYNPRAPLIFALDFNVEPGAAAVVQEMALPNGLRGTGVIGEVYVPFDSDTEVVCNRLVADWEGHEGPVLVYGDATGGRRTTSGVRGSDWKIVRDILGRSFGLKLQVPKANPLAKDRVNSMRSRIKAADGTVRFMVDPVQCPRLVRDFEGVRVLEGGSGEIDKKKDLTLTHWTEAMGYYVHRRYPVGGKAGARRLAASVGG